MINNMKHELTNRPRRLRTSPVLRSMVRETRISTDTLVYPFFVVEGENIKEEIKTMPGQYRWSIDRLPELFDNLKSSGVSSVLIFGIPDHKDEIGSSAWDENGIVQKALRYIKKEYPDILHVLKKFLLTIDYHIKCHCS